MKVKGGVQKPGSNLEARVQEQPQTKNNVRTTQNPLLLQLQYSFPSAKLHRQYLHDTKIKSNDISTKEKKIPYCSLPFKRLNRTRTLVPALTPTYSQHWFASLSPSQRGYKYTGVNSFLLEAKVTVSKAKISCIKC